MAESVDDIDDWCSCGLCTGYYDREECWCGDPDCDGSDGPTIVDSGPIDMRPVENDNGN